MARRMTASEKWQDPWFAELTPVFKCLWMYLVDSCNHAGIWPVNKRQAEFQIAGEIDWGGALKVFNGRIIPFKSGEEERWFIPKFLKYQYPYGLQYEVRCHQSVIHILLEYNLLQYSNVWGIKGAIRIPQEVMKGIGNPKGRVNKGLLNPYDTRKDKDNSKDNSTSKYIDVFKELWEQYPRKEDKSQALRYFTITVKTDADVSKVKVALANYLEYIKDKDSQYIKMAKTWFHNWIDWVDYKHTSDKPEGPAGRKL